MGAQSFDDHILAINKRGHTVAETRRATALLRAAGFKIVLHWMPNLYGATVDSDRQDFSELWQGYCPDEIKIYPNQLLENAELYEYWQRGEYLPYTTDELVTLLADVKPGIPRYCRVNRVIRDIPSDNVVDGNRRTSLRMDVHKELKRRDTACHCVRCREVRGRKVDGEKLTFNDLQYAADGAEEHFLSFDTSKDYLAGFLRLSLPAADSPETELTDLEDAAIIREVHVYGQSLEVGDSKEGAAQHIGLGTSLIENAERIAKVKGYKRLAVIAAVGTRRYYAGRGFSMGKYLHGQGPLGVTNMSIISLTTDFGTRDGFVGVMKGVILGIAPDLHIVDISHGISPQKRKRSLLCAGAPGGIFPTAEHPRGGGRPGCGHRPPANCCPDWGPAFCGPG